MIKDTYKYLAYKCPKCGIWKADFCLNSKLKANKTKCPECKTKLGYKDLVIEEKQQLTNTRTEIKNR